MGFQIRNDEDAMQQVARKGMNWLEEWNLYYFFFLASFFHTIGNNGLSHTHTFLFHSLLTILG